MRNFITSLLLLLVTTTQVVIADDIIDGNFGPGAIYRMVRPTNWNGSLILYAHGYTSSDLPVALPTEGDALINALAPQGFAIAFTSFSENGWAVKEGSQQTLQLLGLFTSKFGQANKVYLSGGSMGGLITIKLVEQHPNAFVGSLALCPVAGGSRQLFNYYGNTRALFDYFYPGVLPGNAGDVSQNINLSNDIALPALAAIQSDPSGALALANVTQTPIPFANELELVESVVTALVSNAESYQGLSPQIHDQPFFDNQNVVYSSAILPPPLLTTINASIGRYSASPSALAYLDHYYEPNGELTIPMVVLYTSRDPRVPGFNQSSYLDRVTEAGHLDMLVQHSIDRFGHCAFTPEEIINAFSDMILWVEYGIKP